MNTKSGFASNSLFLAGIAIFLSLVGMLFVFEASVAEAFSTFGDQYHFLKQHATGLILGLFLFAVGVIVPSKTWIKFAPVVFMCSLLAMILVFVPGIGLELNGARRWISLGPVSFQSVEFFKFGLISYLALWLTKSYPKPPALLPFLAFVGLSALLLLLQPDLSSLLVLFAIAFGMYFLSGGDVKQIGLVAAAGIPLILLLILLSPYRRDRLTTFLNPESDPSGISYHIRQITLALGRGGVFGQGIGNSQQKFAYIPEASTDSIFAIIAEELGFVGSGVIIILLALFVIISFKIASKQTEPGLKLLGFGLVIWIAFQLILNLAAVVALIPLTGIPLPFFSYGRSAQVMILFATGILVRLGKSQ